MYVLHHLMAFPFPLGWVGPSLQSVKLGCFLLHLQAQLILWKPDFNYHSIYLLRMERGQKLRSVWVWFIDHMSDLFSHPLYFISLLPSCRLTAWSRRLQMEGRFLCLGWYSAWFTNSHQTPELPQRNFSHNIFVRNLPFCHSHCLDLFLMERCCHQLQLLART